MAVSQSQPQTRLVNRVARFTGGGTWTVPAGVTYAVAYVVGGGGGVGVGNTGGNGAASSAALPAGTVSAAGGLRHNLNNRYVTHRSRIGAPNSGQGAALNVEHGNIGNDSAFGTCEGADGARVTGGSSVTPGAAVAVAVGAGGNAGTNGAAGGSGYVWIEFKQEVFV